MEKNNLKSVIFEIWDLEFDEFFELLEKLSSLGIAYRAHRVNDAPPSITPYNLILTGEETILKQYFEDLEYCLPEEFDNCVIN